MNRTTVDRLPRKEYLRLTLDKIREENKLLIWKSRQLTVTWFIIAHCMYQCFMNTNLEVIFQCDTDEKVKTVHFHHFEVLYRNLDPFILMALGVVEMFEKYIIFRQSGSRIIGTPSGADVIASRNPNIIFSDEMSIQKFQELTVASSLPSINGGMGQFIGVATTKPDTYFMTLVNDLGKTMGKSRVPTVPWETVQDYMQFRHNRNGWAVLKINYKTDPEKRTEAWKKWASKGYTTETWSQEMEMNENALSGKPVFSDVPDEIFVAGLDYQPGRVMHRSFDFGPECGCCVFAYQDTKGTLNVLKEIKVFNGTTEDVAKEATEESDRWIEKYPKIEFQDFCDISGIKRTSNAKVTDLDILAEYGIYPTYQWQHIETRLDKVRKLYRKSDKGIYGILIDSNECEYIVQGMMGKYGYQNKANPKPMDSFYADVLDALGYMVDGLYYHTDQPDDVDEEESEGHLRLNSSGLPVE